MIHMFMSGMNLEAMRSNASTAECSNQEGCMLNHCVV